MSSDQSHEKKELFLGSFKSKAQEDESYMK